MRVILMFSFLSFLLSACSGSRPNDLGIKDGKLNPCPNKPNCVNSQASSEDREHSIQPISYIGSRTDEESRIKSVVASMPRTRLIKEETGYLYFEFTSLLMRYVDDVEFYLDDTTKLIHIRSASRLGHSDLGVNRKRMEAIRKGLQEKR